MKYKSVVAWGLFAAGWSLHMLDLNNMAIVAFAAAGTMFVVKVLSNEE